MFCPSPNYVIRCLDVAWLRIKQLNMKWFNLLINILACNFSSMRKARQLLLTLISTRSSITPVSTVDPADLSITNILCIHNQPTYSKPMFLRNTSIRRLEELLMDYIRLSWNITRVYGWSIWPIHWGSPWTPVFLFCFVLFCFCRIPPLENSTAELLVV